MFEHGLECLLTGTLSCVTLFTFCISHFFTTVSHHETIRIGPGYNYRLCSTYNWPLSDCSKLSWIYLGTTRDPYSKFWWLPPPVTWLNFRHLATELHLCLFAMSCGHLNVFYNGFAENWHLLLVTTKPDHSGVLNNFDICLTTTVVILWLQHSLNNHHKRWIAHVGDPFYNCYTYDHDGSGSIKIISRGLSYKFLFNSNRYSANIICTL